MFDLSIAIKNLISRSIQEDISHGDITTDSLIPPEHHGEAVVIVKDKGTLAGITIAMEVFLQIDPAINYNILVNDGGHVKVGDTVAELNGKTKSLLKGERLALNFLQRASGIATETAEYVKTIEGTGARIVDTRKTTPGLREIEKYAVKLGGGYSHRFNLSDGILIKDNHISSLRPSMTIRDIISRAKANSPHTLTIEIEVENYEEAKEAFDGNADIILLDNMTPEDMNRVVKLVNGKCLLEASGGIKLDTVRAVAESGVDLISVGSITHSVKSLDISLDFKLT
jgi:nicotinate-nucleotide pyrophosphorylase (carboxylating)